MRINASNLLQRLLTATMVLGTPLASAEPIGRGGELLDLARTNVRI